MSIINVNTNGELLSPMVVLSQIMKSDNFYNVVKAVPVESMSTAVQHKVITLGKFTANDNLAIELYVSNGHKVINFYIGEKDGTNILLNIGHPALDHDMVSSSPFASDVAGMIIGYLSEQGLVSIQ